MKKTILFIGIIFFAVSVYSQYNNLHKIARQIKGKTIAQVIDFFQLDSNDFNIVQEPPMIIRGIRANKDELQMLIYTERTSNPLNIDTTGNDWKIMPARDDYDLIKDSKVIGFSLKFGDALLTRGKTIVYYNFDWLQ
jgi:hypothetical protein